MGDVRDAAVSAEFIAWCRDHNVQATSIAVHQFDDGERGVIATASITEGTVLVRASEPALLSARSAARDSAIQQALPSAHGETLPDRVVLCVHLLLEASKRDSSQWWPYLRSLPTEYTTLGAFPADLAQEFQATHAVQACERAQTQFATDYAKAEGVLKAAGVCERLRTRGAWRWAAGTVASRTMHLPGSDCGCLTPLADMHNFCPPPAPQPPATPANPPHAQEDAAVGTAGHGSFDESSAEYVVKAGRAYARGEQVFLCYGSYTNLELLEHYGFLLPHNPHEEVLTPSDAWPCSTAGAGGTGKAFLHPSGEPSWGLLLRLRLHFCSHADSSARANAWQGERVSVDNEAKVYACIAAVCMKVLEQFPSSTRQDKEMLDDIGAASSYHKRCLCLVLQWRMQHKQALARAYKHACACTASLKEHYPGPHSVSQ